MIIPKDFLKLIEEACFRRTGLKTFVSAFDYTRLSEDVAAATGRDPIGINTWKRIFGHLLKPDGSPYNTSEKTVQIIAEYLGCNSWEEVCENEEYLFRNLRGGNNDSILIRSNTNDISILVSSLKVDDIIEIKSRPNRVLHLKFLYATANSRWYRIIYTVGSSNLQNMDEVEIASFAIDRPLVILQVKRNGIFIGEYLAGNMNVIYSVKKKKKM